MANQISLRCFPAGNESPEANGMSPLRSGGPPCTRTFLRRSRLGHGLFGRRKCEEGAAPSTSPRRLAASLFENRTTRWRGVLAPRHCASAPRHAARLAPISTAAHERRSREPRPGREIVRDSTRNALPPKGSAARSGVSRHGRREPRPRRQAPVRGRCVRQGSLPLRALLPRPPRRAPRRYHANALRLAQGLAGSASRSTFSLSSRIRLSPRSARDVRRRSIARLRAEDCSFVFRGKDILRPSLPRVSRLHRFALEAAARASWRARPVELARSAHALRMPDRIEPRARIRGARSQLSSRIRRLGGSVECRALARGRRAMISLDRGVCLAESRQALEVEPDTHSVARSRRPHRRALMQLRDAGALALDDRLEITFRRRPRGPTIRRRIAHSSVLHESRPGGSLSDGVADGR